MIAFIILNSSLVPWIEGLCNSNLLQYAICIQVIGATLIHSVKFILFFLVSMHTPFSFCLIELVSELITGTVKCT